MPLRNGVKYLAANSQYMGDCIFKMQNENYLLQCQLAQRGDYSKAKKWATGKTFFTLGFTILSIVSALIIKDWLTALTSFFAVMLITFNKYADKSINSLKKHAAGIQQYIDATLFAKALDGTKGEWGTLPSETDVANSISKFQDCDTSGVRNWYCDYSSLSSCAQVFYCQRENVRWNRDLNNKYLRLHCCILAVLIVSVFVFFFVIDLNFIRCVCILAWITPTLEFLVSNIKDLWETISLSQKLESTCDSIESKLSEEDLVTVKEDLIKIQNRIKERREVGYLIPDWFYRIHREKQQAKEDQIAKTITSHGKINGDNDDPGNQKEN